MENEKKTKDEPELGYCSKCAENNLIREAKLIVGPYFGDIPLCFDCWSSISSQTIENNFRKFLMSWSETKWDK